MTKSILKGYTLIELVVVISLLSFLLVSVGIPEIRSYLDSFALQVSAREIQHQLELVRRLAKANHNTYQLYCINKSILRPSYTTISQTSLISKNDLPAGICLSGHLRFCFSSTGFPVPSGWGTLTISSRHGASRNVIVSSVGMVRVE